MPGAASQREIDADRLPVLAARRGRADTVQAIALAAGRIARCPAVDAGEEAGLAHLADFGGDAVALAALRVERALKELGLAGHGAAMELLVADEAASFGHVAAERAVLFARLAALWRAAARRAAARAALWRADVGGAAVDGR